MRTSSVDLLIIDILSRNHSHLTSHQVYERLRERLPAVNASTVYRALERLAKCGRISISDMGFGSAVFETVEAGAMHHHLVCQQCGQVNIVEHAEVAELFGQLEKKNRFKIVTNHLILFGLCEDCRQPVASEH